jgi:predicted acetyltransferase
MPWNAPTPPRPLSRPVALRPVDRRHRAVLLNLGQLFRHDLSESYGLLPNDDGTFNDRMVDRFLADADPGQRAWLITAAGRLAGFSMTLPLAEGGTRIAAFFVVRALRRTGVGREAARLTIGQFPGPWRIGFQRYNAGVESFWSGVASALAGDAWRIYDGPAPENRPPDTFIEFTT